MNQWNGHLEIRRYALFNNTLRGDYMVVIKGKDIKTASKWTGFKKWIGKTRQADTRNIAKS